MAGDAEYDPRNDTLTNSVTTAPIRLKKKLEDGVQGAKHFLYNFFQKKKLTKEIRVTNCFSEPLNSSPPFSNRTQEVRLLITYSTTLVNIVGPMFSGGLQTNAEN